MDRRAILLILVAVVATGCTSRVLEQELREVEFVTGHYPRGLPPELVLDGVTARWLGEDSTSVFMSVLIRRETICDVFTNGTFTVSGQDVRVELISGRAHQCRECPHRLQARAEQDRPLSKVVQETGIRLSDLPVDPARHVRLTVSIDGTPMFNATVPARP